MSDPVLRYLGLARRAGFLILGLRESAAAKNAVLYIAASDAGGHVPRNLRRLSEANAVPFLILPHMKTELGRALGRSECAAAALTDKGLAAAVLQAAQASPSD